MTVVEVVVGLVIISLIGFDVFTSIIVPRPAHRGLRLSAYLVRFTWPVWRAAFLGLRSEQTRESYLGVYAPAAVVLSLLMWLVGLIVGFGFILFALRWQIRPPPDSLWTAMYFAATALLSSGFGDWVPVRGLSRIVALFAAGAGLAAFAVVIAYLFSLFASFQRRENFVIVLDASAGAPPSGVQVLETHAEVETRHHLANLFAAGQSWSADILETHLAYPILNFFRSSHRDESWIGALGALLDSAALHLSTIVGDPSNRGQAKLMIEVGTHLSEDLVHYFGITPEHEAGIERHEFDAVAERLRQAGYELRDREESWSIFRNLRSQYAWPLNAMAKYWAIPPAQWIGDRSAIGRH